MAADDPSAVAEPVWDVDRWVEKERMAGTGSEIRREGAYTFPLCQSLVLAVARTHADSKRADRHQVVSLPFGFGLFKLYRTRCTRTPAPRHESSRHVFSNRCSRGGTSTYQGRMQGLLRTERRRNRTYPATGYAASPVLKTGWATGPGPLRGQPSS